MIETGIRSAWLRGIRFTSQFLPVLLFAALGPTSIASAQVSDTTAPQLQSISFSPTSIDTRTGAQTVSVVARITDDLSGIASTTIRFYASSATQPSNQRYAYCYLNSWLSVASRNVNGVPLDATGDFRCTFPQYSQEGTWTIDYIQPTDYVGNNRSLSGTALTVYALGSLTVTSNPAPAAQLDVASISVTPAAVDVSAAAQTVTIVLQGVSAGSFGSGYICFQSPTYSREYRGNSSVQATAYSNCAHFSSSNRIGGTAQFGDYSTTFTVPRYAKAGSWSIYQVYLSDSQSGAYLYYTRNNLAVAAWTYRCTQSGCVASAGPVMTPWNISVTSAPEDTTPPVLQEFNLSSPSLDVALASYNLQFNLRATDDLAGVQFACVGFVSPNGQQFRSGCVYPPSTTGSIYFPQYSEAGNWNVYSFQVCDRLSQCRLYIGYGNDLAALGFPSAIQVSAGMQVSNAAGTVGTSVDLSARLTSTGQAVSGRVVDFKLNGVAVGSATTDANGVATLPGVSLGSIAIGSYPNAIVASFPGDATVPAVTGAANLTVTGKLTQFITFGTLVDRTTSESPITVAATASSGLPVSFSAGGSCTVNGSQVTLTGAGQCRITASQTGNAQYDAASNVTRAFNVVAKSTQAITFAALADRAYGSAPFLLGATASSGLPVAYAVTGNCTVSGSTLSTGNAGTCVVTASQAGSATFDPATSITHSFQITRAALLVTANDKVRQFGGPDPAYDATYAGLAGNDTLASLASRATCSSVASQASPAGTYPISCAGASSANYDITYAAGTLTVLATPHAFGLEVTMEGAGGIVESPETTPPIACSSAPCSGTAPYGSTVTLTARPVSAATVFKGWSGCSSVDEAGACSVVMSDARQVNAVFEPSTFPLTVTFGGAGTGSVAAVVDGSPTPLTCGPGGCSATIPNGAAVSLAASPGQGMVFQGWGITCTGTSCAFSMNAAKSVLAIFEPGSHPVTVTVGGTAAGRVASAPAGIDCSTSSTAGCSATFTRGSSVTLTATYDAASVIFAGWSGGACRGTASTCTVPVDGAVAVVATFAPARYDLSVQLLGDGGGRVGDGGSLSCSTDGSTACTVPEPSGSTVTLVATADAVSRFLAWSGCASSNGTTCTVAMNAARSVTASFGRSTFPLEVTFLGEGSGSMGITVDGVPSSLTCTQGGCTGVVPGGSAVVLTSAAAAGSLFQGWGIACTGAASTCGFKMDRSWTVMATFAPALHALSVNVTGAGTGTITSAPVGIACTSGSSVGCSSTVAHGSSVTLTATHDASRFVFAGWSGGYCSGGSPVCTLTMDMAKSATARFEPATHRLTATLLGTGAGTISGPAVGGTLTCTSGSCSADEPVGATVALTAAPATGSVFRGWSGCSSVSGTTCNVAMTSARSVAAQFDPAGYQLTLNLAGTGTGAVTGVTWDTCSATSCRATVPTGSTLTLSAAAAGSSTFKGWGILCTGTGTCRVKMNSTKTLSATFTAP